MLSDPAAYGTFAETNAAYHLLADSAARARYNEDHGLLPLIESQAGERPDILEQVGDMLPDGWPWLVAGFAFPVIYFVSFWVFPGAPYYGVPFFHSWEGLIVLVVIANAVTFLMAALFSDR